MNLFVVSITFTNSSKKADQNDGVYDTKTYGVFVAPAVLVRTISTLCVSIEKNAADSDSDSDYAIDCDGTHPLEDLNGDIRTCEPNNDTISAVSHTVKTPRKKINIKNVHQNRVNTGGIRLSREKNILERPHIKPIVLLNSLFSLANRVTEEIIITKEIEADCVNVFFKFILNVEEFNKEHDSFSKIFFLISKLHSR